MYKKLIALVLIFVLMFNFISNNVVYAMPAALVGYGLIAFAAALTAYGVTVTDNQHVKLLYEQFQNWSDSTGLTEYMQNSYYQNKMMITSTAIGVAALGIGLNTWIRTEFSKGYNTKTISSGDVYEYVPGQLIERKYNLPSAGVYSYNYFLDGNIVEIQTGTSGGIGTGFDYYIYTGIFEELYNGKYYNTVKINGEIMENSGSSYLCQQDSINYGHTIRIIDGYVYVTIMAQKEGVWYSNTVSSVAMTNEYPSQTTTNISYYAGEAVDYPVGNNPEDRDINLPPPNLGSPNLTYDGQDYIYTGTPDDFLEEYSTDEDYINKALDSVLDHTKSISQPIVDTVAGTITWTNTGVIDYPLNPPIVIPTPSIPATVEEGVGETNSILTGVTEYIGNIFAAPTLAIDFSPIMQVGLVDKFPFCLPFDLKTLISGFDSKSEAPEWELKWKVKDTEVAYNVEFEQFERLAEITRWGVTLMYVVSLIMISRKLIGGE